MLKEEAKVIKETLKNCSPDGFSASNGWLDGQKTAYTMTEQQNVGKPGNVSEQTIPFWMVRLQELTAGY